MAAAPEITTTYTRVRGAGKFHTQTEKKYFYGTEILKAAAAVATIFGIKKAVSNITPVGAFATGGAVYMGLQWGMTGLALKESRRSDEAKRAKIAAFNESEEIKTAVQKVAEKAAKAEKKKTGTEEKKKSSDE